MSFHNVFRLLHQPQSSNTFLTQHLPLLPLTPISIQCTPHRHTLQALRISIWHLPFIPPTSTQSQIIYSTNTGSKALAAIIRNTITQQHPPLMSPTDSCRTTATAFRLPTKTINGKRAVNIIWAMMWPVAASTRAMPVPRRAEQHR